SGGCCGRRNLLRLIDSAEAASQIQNQNRACTQTRERAVSDRLPTPPIFLPIVSLPIAGVLMFSLYGSASEPPPFLLDEAKGEVGLKFVFFGSDPKQVEHQFKTVTESWPSAAACVCIDSTRRRSRFRRSGRNTQTGSVRRRPRFNPKNCH